MNKIENLLNKYPNIKHATPTKFFDINIYRVYCGKNYKYLKWYNLNFHKNELLFLQVYSENQSVKDLCFDVTKIPTDFAQEFLN